ncbi:MAG: phosphoribosylcarboxyaminoimidazole (NCAIR) mutase, partial [Candidatus Azotimanducaceae bacterium]
AQIMGTSDSELRAKLIAEREESAQAVRDKNNNLKL